MTQNSWNAEFNDGKGELLVGNNTRPVVVPVGVDGTVLTADSGAAEGVSWQAGFNPANTSAFLASLTATATDVTGNVGNYTFSTAGGGTVTEVFDVGANFNPATGVFTAPVSGKYHFHCRFSLGDLAAGFSGSSCTITATGSLTQVAQGGILNPTVPRDINDQLGIVEASAFFDLVAGDQVTASVNCSGGAGDTVDVIGQVLNLYFTYFYGYLVSTAGGVSGIFGPGASTDRAIATWNGITGTAQYDNPTTRITAAGEMTNTGQPMFEARMTVSTGGVTGAGGSYFIGNNGGGTATVTVDQGSDTSFVAGDLVFTAPVLGNYMFLTTFVLDGITAPMTSCQITFERNAAANYWGSAFFPFAVANPLGSLVHQDSLIIILNPGDVIKFNVSITGGAGDTVSVRGAPVVASNQSSVQGFLIC